MAQIKIFGLKRTWASRRQELSDLIHSCLVEALALPEEKRFQRFFLMDESDFLYLADRTERYLILEVSLFEGRTVEAKKRLIRLFYKKSSEALGLRPQDLEITLFETPKHNWGIRGEPGDELNLSYKVEV